MRRILRRARCAPANSSLPEILESARFRGRGGLRVRRPRKNQSPLSGRDPYGGSKRRTSLQCGIVPTGIGRGGNETHRALGERGDGQAGIDAEIGRHYRPIADVHILVAEHAVARVDYSASRGIGNHATSDAMRSPGNIEQNFRKHTHGESPGKAREFLSKLVGFRNVGRDLAAPAYEKPSERPEPGALPAHLDLIIQCLHAKQNYKFTRPSPRLQYAQSTEWVAEERDNDIHQPESDPTRTRPAIGEDGGKHPHGIGTIRVADCLNMGMLIDIDAGADGDALR